MQTLVTAIGAGIGVWGAINLLEDYGNDNQGSKSQEMKHFIPRRSRNAFGLGERPLAI